MTTRHHALKSSAQQGKAARRSRIPAQDSLKRFRARRLLVEALEDRRVLASVLWDGGGGDFNWGNALN